MEASTSTGMTVYRTFSKLQIARIFGVNRGTIYSWEGDGFPVRQPGRHGRSAKVDFEEALEWYLYREEIRGVSEKGLAILEDAIRRRKEKHYGGRS